MRTTHTFHIEPGFREQLAAFASRYEEFALLDSCGNTAYGAPNFDYLLACAPVAVHVHPVGDSLAAGDVVSRLPQGDWLFGYVGYEFNANTEAIFPPEKKLFDTPPLRFFVPGIVIQVKGAIATLHLHPELCESAENIHQQIRASIPVDVPNDTIRLQPLVSASDYVETVEKIRQHIIDGDIYELNYCQPFVAEQVDIDPLSVYNRLCEVSQAPFSVLYRFGEQYLMCASPERFFSFDGKRMSSMPIKGTRKRASDPAADEALRHALANSEKDRAEHVMIVDLVRNDLTPLAEPGTIKVDALYGIYAFPQVFQMVSTISAQLREGADLRKAMIQAFPMGSMTGAPKVRAMQLAATYEPYQRGMYSGTFGYFTPEGTCDFNVVIRSLLYNANTQLLAAYAGGAIVYDSEPEKELEECYVKLSGIMRALTKAQ